MSQLVVLNCEKCIQVKDCFKGTAEAPLQKGNIPTSIFDHWHIDLCSCNAIEKEDVEEIKVEKETKKHKVYVIGAIDVFSKYMVGRVAADKTAATVGRFLIDEIIMRFGVPSKITTNRGTEFNGPVMNQIREDLKKHV